MWPIALERKLIGTSRTCAHGSALKRINSSSIIIVRAGRFDSDQRMFPVIVLTLRPLEIVFPRASHDRKCPRNSFRPSLALGRPEFVFGGFVEFVSLRVDPLPKLIGKRRYIRNPACVWS